MALFGKKKKEEEAAPCCCGCGCSEKAEEDVVNGSVAEEPQVTDGGINPSGSVKILGTGCAKCNQLEQATIEALKELGMDGNVEHVTDFAEIAAYGVMTTPGLVVDGKVVSYGKVLKKDEVIKILQQVRG